MIRLPYVKGVRMMCAGTLATAFFVQAAFASHPEAQPFSCGKDKQFEQAMDDFIADNMAENNAEGVSIVVVEKDRVVYQKGFGFANKNEGKPVDASTLFHVGSITKLFTGIGIMQLAEQGKIDIDAPIQQYLPDFSIKYHWPSPFPITIRSIMAHQSGIFGDKLSGDVNGTYPSEDYRTFPDFAKNEYAAYSPHYIASYSNFAVSLLGLVIERVSGESYESYVYNKLLKPCGMDESGFDPATEHPLSLAKGYDVDGSELPYYYIDCNPAGFLASSSNDMTKFIRMILNQGRVQKKRILYPGTLKSMYMPHTRYLPMTLHDDYASPYNFGLSWIIENRSHDYLGRVIGHGGNLPPFNSSLLIAEKQGLGVFVTSNKADFYPEEIAYHALEQAGKIYRNKEKPALPDVPPATICPKHLQKMFTGTYCMLNSEPIDIYTENDTMYFHPLHAERIPLLYHTDDWMSLVVDGNPLPDVRLGIKFVGGQKTMCVEQRTSQNLFRMVTGNVFYPKNALDPEWQARMGTYAEASSGMPALELVTDYLSKTGDPFVKAISLDDYTPYVFNPAGTSSLIVQGLGRSAQETIYFTGDTAHYLGYSFVKLPPVPAPAARARSFDAEKAAAPLLSQAAAADKFKQELTKQLRVR